MKQRRITRDRLVRDLLERSAAPPDDVPTPLFGWIVVLVVAILTLYVFFKF